MENITDVPLAFGSGREEHQTLSLQEENSVLLIVSRHLKKGLRKLKILG